MINTFPNSVFSPAYYHLDDDDDDDDDVYL
jgi:hypothetical protein